MKEYQRSLGTGVDAGTAVKVSGGAVGDVLQQNADGEFVPAAVPTGSPSATAAGQLQVSTGAGTAYVARGRVLSGTLAARDALATVYEGDQWLVSSGASAGTFWKRIDGAWQWEPLATSAAGWRSALGVPAQAAVLLLDGSQPMGGDLDMDGQIVKNLALATADGDAASKQYVDAAIATTVAAATTTDATETTCGTRAPADGTHVVRALVAASSGSVRIAWELVACVTVSSGAATLGYVAEATCTQDPAPYSVALDTSGGAVRVRVTGAASTTIAWESSLYISGAS